MPRTRASLILLLYAAIFAVAYTQAPLYYSNQNQYFVHGLAKAGFGFLQDDWLANTADPTPIFSALVAFTHRFLSDSWFHAYFLLCLAIYALAMLAIFTSLTGSRPHSLAGLYFITLLLLMHSGVVRFASAQLFGKDYPWFFQAGIANQYILGFGLQPSVAGIFLVVSLALFAGNRTWLAIGAASLAATLHGTYLLGAASLTIGYMAVLYRERGLRSAALAGALALALVTPTLIYNAMTFAPTSPKLFGSAQSILAQVRIPHHTLIERWFDWIAALQVAWIVLGIYLVRGTRLGAALAVAFAFALLLTIVQVSTEDDFLALLFPWRISAVMVPVATTIVLTRLIQVVANVLNKSASAAWPQFVLTCIVLSLILVAGGLGIEWFGLAYRMSDEELPLYRAIRDRAQPGDVYLIPVQEPKRGARGSSSTSFLPPPRFREDTSFIAVDLQRFRVFTGAPLFVDFKAIPYKDVEVLEWHRRFNVSRDWYKKPNVAMLLNPAILKENGITHVVAPASQPIDNPQLKAIFADPFYILYRVE